MKSMLVISDNIEMKLFLLDAVNDCVDRDEIEISLGHSPLNIDVPSHAACGSTQIDLRNPETLHTIIANFDTVLSVHCKQIFPSDLVRSVVCINLHPGFNPFNRGWFPQAFSIVNGKTAGATLHVMDEEIDHGPIIDQEEVLLSESDTSFTAYRKVIAAEKVLLRRNLDSLVNNHFISQSPNGEGNYNSISDYRQLCEIDLNHLGTFRQHLDLLRALTHPPYQNAYVDLEDGRYFLSIDYHRHDEVPEA